MDVVCNFGAMQCRYEDKTLKNRYIGFLRKIFNFAVIFDLIII